MESEPLAACPVCGDDVHSGVQGVTCRAPLCRYAIAIPALLTGNAQRVAQLVEQHNTLARRAEIGRLVDELMPENGRNLTLETLDGRFGAFRTGKLGAGDSLLEALRQLKRKVSDGRS